MITKDLSKCLLAAGVAVSTLWSGAAMAQLAHNQLPAPSVPANLQVPAGNTAYLKVHAAGTQNYVCIPGANGPAWRFLGPQATLFVPFPSGQAESQAQVGTHFLSLNPSEPGKARPAWQSSFDTSAVWGNVIAASADPSFVAPGAIPWLLLEIVGSQRGPTGGAALTQTTYIQRVNTSGGIAPSLGCDESGYGGVALVPYTTDYFFYRAQSGRR